MKSLQAQKQNFLLFASIAFAFAMPFGIKAIQITSFVWFVAAAINFRFRELKDFFQSKHKTEIFLFFAFLFFYFLHILGTFYSQDLKFAQRNLEVKIYFLLFPVLVIGNRSNLKNFLPKILFWFVLGVSSATLIAFVRIAYLYFFENQDFVFLKYSNFSIFNHPSYEALMVNFALIILIFYRKKLLQIFSFRTLLWKKFFIWTLNFLSIFLAVSLFFYDSRANLLALFVVGLLVFISSSIKGRYLYLFVFFAAAIAITSRMSRFTSPLVRSRQANLYENTRFVLWNLSEELVRENFFTGVGTGDVIIELTEKARKENIPFEEEMHYNVHNDFLESFVRLGIWGFGAELAIFALLVLSALKRKDKAFFFFVVIVAVNFFFESMTNRITGNTFFLFFATVLAFPDIRKNSYIKNFYDFKDFVFGILHKELGFIVFLLVFFAGLYWIPYGNNIDFYDTLIKFSWLGIENFSLQTLVQLPYFFTGILLKISGLNILLWLKIIYVFLLASDATILYKIFTYGNEKKLTASVVVFSFALFALVNNPMAAGYADILLFFLLSLSCVLISSANRHMKLILTVLLIAGILESLYFGEFYRFSFHSWKILFSIPVFFIYTKLTKNYHKIIFWTAIFLATVFFFAAKFNNVYDNRPKESFYFSANRRLYSKGIWDDSVFLAKTFEYQTLIDLLKNSPSKLATSINIQEYIDYQQDSLLLPKDKNAEIWALDSLKKIEIDTNLLFDNGIYKIYCTDSANLWPLKTHWKYPQDGTEMPFTDFYGVKPGVYTLFAEIKVYREDTRYKPRATIGYETNSGKFLFKRVFLPKDNLWHSYKLTLDFDTVRNIRRFYVRILYSNKNEGKNISEVKNIKLFFHSND